MGKLLIQEWVYENTKPSEQALLLSALRGIDIEEASELTKPLVKMIRDLIGKSFVPDNKNTYSTKEIYSAPDVTLMLMEGRKYSKHWYDHITGAIRVIANKHPNNYTRYYWGIINDFITYSKKENKLEE